MFLEVFFEGQGMSRRNQSWQSGRSAGSAEREWLLRLIAAMERIARPEVRALPIDRVVSNAVRMQLARPPTAYPPGTTNFSLRN